MPQPSQSQYMQMMCLLSACPQEAGTAQATPSQRDELALIAQMDALRLLETSKAYAEEPAEASRRRPPRLEKWLEGESSRGRGDSPLLRSPASSRKPSAEPKTPVKKTVPQSFDSPAQRGAAPHAYANTPSPQQSNYRGGIGSSAQTQPASAGQAAQVYSVPPPPQAVQAAQPRAAQTSALRCPGMVAAPAVQAGQLATPVHRSPPFFLAPSSAGSGSSVGMQWAASPGFQVFQFPQRPAPHIVTPAPPLPFSSPNPPRQCSTHGLTPGPRPSAPEGYSGGVCQDRATAPMADYTANAMAEWRRCASNCP